jgi:hypothetical protein
MTLEAEKARANAISFEVKKDGLTQRQSGDWQLRFTVAALDMHERITTAPMGTRFACVLVEVNDDETPADREAQIRDKWRELGPVKQAGIRCKDAVFWAFLEEEMHFSDVSNEYRAANVVRLHCCVDSRSELEKPGNTHARQLWYGLDNGFQAWKARENG